MSSPLDELDFYFVPDGESVRACSVEEWSAFMERDDRVVAQDRDGAVMVSTVFIGLHIPVFHLVAPGPPLVWETMIFGGPNDGWQWRTASRGQALAVHRKASSRYWRRRWAWQRSRR